MTGGPLEQVTVTRYVTPPRSTIVQPGPVHGALAGDPAAAPRHLPGAPVR